MTEPISRTYRFALAACTPIVRWWGRLEVTGLEPTIKFPNDVLIGGRKVAGILAESSDGRVVLGIGVNANQTSEQLPDEAQTEPTSLRVEAGEPVNRAQLLAAILLHLERAYDAWAAMDTSASG